MVVLKSYRFILLIFSYFDFFNFSLNRSLSISYRFEIINLTLVVRDNVFYDNPGPDFIIGLLEFIRIYCSLPQFSVSHQSHVYKGLLSTHVSETMH